MSSASLEIFPNWSSPSSEIFSSMSLASGYLNQIVLVSVCTKFQPSSLSRSAWKVEHMTSMSTPDASAQSAPHARRVLTISAIFFLSNTLIHTYIHFTHTHRHMHRHKLAQTATHNYTTFTKGLVKKNPHLNFAMLISRLPSGLEIPSWTFFNSPFRVDFENVIFYIIWWILDWDIAKVLQRLHF